MVLDELPEYSTRITQEIECPFCNAKIKVLYKPSVIQFAVSRVSAKTARIPYKTQEKYILLVEKCPNCGKSKKEIEKRLKEGKQPTNEEIIKRMKEAGLPLKIKG